MAELWRNLKNEYFFLLKIIISNLSILKLIMDLSKVLQNSLNNLNQIPPQSSNHGSQFEQQAVDAYDQLQEEEIDRMMEYYPEDFVKYDHIFLRGEINNIEFPIIVDTGAQGSFITETFARKVGIDSAINHAFRGMAMGVGNNNILGKIFGTDVRIIDKDGSATLVPTTFMVMQQNGDSFLDDRALIGMDFLARYRCILDFNTNSITFNGKTFEFLGEYALNELKGTRNGNIKNIEGSFFNILSDDSIENKQNSIKLIKKIVQNIINNPNEEKFTSINTQNDNFINNIMMFDSCMNFLRILGFADNDDKLRLMDYDRSIFDKAHQVICQIAF